MCTGEKEDESYWRANSTVSTRERWQHRVKGGGSSVDTQKHPTCWV